MERIDTKTVLTRLSGLPSTGQTGRMLAALGDAIEGTKVIFARAVVSEILPGLLIRLQTTPDLDRRVPGFRELVDGLQRLQPEARVDDYALITESEVHRLFLTGDPVVVVGAYSMGRTSQDQQT